MQVLLIIASQTFAQSPYEAIRYSETSFLGTSRGRGLSGASGALGADFTSIGVNPAGVGMFRKSELMVTLGIQGKTNFSGYGNSETNDLRLRANIPNIGFVFTKLFVDEKGKKTKGKWSSFNFAAGINRIADFNEYRYWESNKAQRSLLPALASELNGVPPSQISMSSVSAEAVMGWNAYLINPFSDDTLSYYSVTDNQEVTQKINIETQGGINDISFTLGANYNDKLYFGAYIGVPVLRYTEEITHRESDEENSYIGFDNFNMKQKLETTGVGFNTRIGLLYRVNNYFRVGASIHSPTYYSMNDAFSGEIKSSLDTATYSYQTPDGSFDYSLSTPWRFNGSAAVMFSKYGFFSIDYEYVDYRKARYFFDSNYSSFENTLNDDVDNIARNASNIRAGLEFAINILRIRGGYAIYGSSLEGESFLGVNSAQMASGGIGLRLKKVYFDIAYSRLEYKEKLNVLFNGIRSTDRVVRNMATATFGFRF